MRKVSGRRTAIDLDNLVRRSGARLKSAAVKARQIEGSSLQRSQAVSEGRSNLAAQHCRWHSPLARMLNGVKNQAGLFRNSAKTLTANADRRPARAVIPCASRKPPQERCKGGQRKVGCTLDNAYYVILNPNRNVVERPWKNRN